MNNEEKTQIMKDAFAGQDIFEVLSVDNVNHKPHPFMIGPKHVEYAANHNSGMLTKDVCEKVPCSHSGCNLPYSAHSADTVCFIQLKRNANTKEAQDILSSVVLKTGQIVDGFTFVETKEKFRIII